MDGSFLTFKPFYTTNGVVVSVKRKRERERERENSGNSFSVESFSLLLGIWCGMNLLKQLQKYGKEESKRDDEAGETKRSPFFSRDEGEMKIASPVFKVIYHSFHEN